MVKIKVRSGRGTRVIDVDSDATKWTGTQFKAIQAARKKAALFGSARYTAGRAPSSTRSERMRGGGFS